MIEIKAHVAGNGGAADVRSPDERELDSYRWHNSEGRQAAFDTLAKYHKHRRRLKLEQALERDIVAERRARQWDDDAAVRAEFRDPAIFLAYQKAIDAGRITVKRPDRGAAL